MGNEQDTDAVKALSDAETGISTIQHDFTYDFANFFHPYAGELIKQLNKHSLAGLFDPVFLDGLRIERQDFFGQPFYHLLSSKIELNAYAKEIDVGLGGPYANYNWELFFHFPLTIAVHLSKNQRFAEAQRWFHYIFDPTCNDSSVPPPKRFWKFLAFRYAADTTPIDDQLALLSTPDGELTKPELALKKSLLTSYSEIKAKPFHPHVVAQNRVISYQYCVVMKYLDNLIAWGDSLFRQDTVESINEATQIYVLAANLLGARPQRIPPRGTTGAKSFKRLKDDSEHVLDKMGNTWVELEGKFPSLLGQSTSHGADSDPTGPLFGIGRTLYFCIPPNDKLLSYWDTVADRLFKVRNCMNIEGVVRQLALFDPPIDPGMLVKAAAAGIDIGSIVSGLNQPPSPLRTPWLIQKALELCAEVRGLGAALLAAIEKQEGEKLAVLRQSHEIRIHRMMQDVRYLQWQQAREATEALLKGRASVLERFHYYQERLGLTQDSNAAPDELPLERQDLTEENFEGAYSALVEQYNKPISGDEYPGRSYKSEGNLRLLNGEYDDLNGHADRAFGFRTAASVVDVLTAGLALLPDLNMKASYWGIGPEGQGITGGTRFSAAGSAVRAELAILADNEQLQGQYASKLASYERRADDWMLQCNLAARELMHIGRQVLGSLIAEQVTRHEYENIKKQIEYSDAVYQTLQDKYTNEELYAWMQGETSRLYYEYYRFAFDTARKAEKTMKRELMRPELDATDYIKFNYWEGGRKGLLSGEALYLDVKRMEMAYHENNKRELELTKHVSLRQLAPAALLSLKATGSCEVTVPEWLFDLDCPGHYMRRIKSVSLSIPAVAGPYTSVNCTLTLVKSTLRHSPLGDYARDGSEDGRFIDSYGATQSIVTSSGQNDSGQFETNLRDERFLPFEGAGAESTWKLELPAQFRQFDYNTISDAILHMRYTARQGGALLQGNAVTHLDELVTEANSAGLALLLSLKHDFPGEWHRFVTGTADFSAVVRRDYFPYFTQGKGIALNAIRCYAIKAGKLEPDTPPVSDLAALAQQLNDEGAFTLPLSESDVLVRDQQADVFALIYFSLE